MKSKILPALAVLLSLLLLLLGAASRLPAERLESIRNWLFERKKVLVLQGSNFENRHSNPGKADHGSEKQEKGR